MTTKAKIKVIKKGELKAVLKPTVAAKETKQAQMRVMVSNVTTWVSDFQHRKSEEAKIAIEKFFNHQPRTSGV